MRKMKSQILLLPIDPEKIETRAVLRKKAQESSTIENIVTTHDELYKNMTISIYGSYNVENGCFAISIKNNTPVL